MTFYVCSKIKHAPKWRELRAHGTPIISTWIDDGGLDEVDDLSDLAHRCVNEASQADALLLFIEPGDILKGCFVEVGAALASGKEVRCVGDCESLTTVFKHHRLWSTYPSLDDALRN